MDSKIARCLLISKVLVADGIMTENERAFLNHYMDQLGLDDAEREQVVSLEGWDEAEPIVKAMSTEEKHAVLDAASNAATSRRRPRSADDDSTWSGRTTLTTTGE